MSVATWPAASWHHTLLWLEKRRPGMVINPFFTMNAVLRLRGPLRPAALATAVDTLVARHDLLRTRLRFTDAGPVQEVAAPMTGLLETTDDDEVRATHGWLHPPVSAEAESPLRVRLAHIGSHEHLLSVHLHHLMADPVTLWRTVGGLADLYTAEVDHGQSPPPPSAQYPEYTEMEGAFGDAGRAEALQWWGATLADAQLASVRLDEQGEPFAFRAELLNPARVAAVERLARRHRSPFLAVLLAGFVGAFAPYLGAGDTVLCNTWFNCRDRPRWQRMLGPCLTRTYLPLPRPVDGLDGDHLRMVRDRVIGARRHARQPLTTLIDSFPAVAAAVELAPFVEHIPQNWPAGLRFGAAEATVVDSAGPGDVGTPADFCLWTRSTLSGEVRVNVCGCGIGWTAGRAAALPGAFARQLELIASD